MTVNTTGCFKGNKIRTVSGRIVDLYEPDTGEIDIQDIAVSLSNLCRYGGHVHEHYSVAEHSVLCACEAMNDGVERELVKAILLHDAAEAYIGDVPRPIKNVISDCYAPLEAIFERAIEQRFGVNFEKHKDVIKHYDMTIFFEECRTFDPGNVKDLQGVDDYPKPATSVECMTPAHARDLFLEFAKNLKIT